MDLQQFFITYLISCASVALTSYFVLYRPAVKLIKEILEDNNLIRTYLGIPGFVIWNLFGIAIAPLLIVQLITRRNDDFIEEFASTVASRKLEDLDE